jgi:hypothetical protein
MQLRQYCLLVTARSLYTFRTLPVPIIRSAKNCSNSHWCVSWVGLMYISKDVQSRLPTALLHNFSIPQDTDLILRNSKMSHTNTQYVSLSQTTS